MSAPMLTGTVTKHGYTISNADGEVLYEAGNSHYDSQAYLSPDDPDAVPISKLCAYCTLTGMEMAKELGMAWGDYEIGEEVDDG